MTERRVTPGFDLETRPTATPDPPRQRRPIDVVGRHAPAPAFDVLPPRRRQRGDRDNRATGFRNTWVAFWAQLWAVGRWCAAASAAAFLIFGAWLGQPWGWITAAVPLVVLALWLASVLAQGRRHMRGEAGPPPGWTGRL
jgi:hypothetical protein